MDKMESQFIETYQKRYPTTLLEKNVNWSNSVLPISTD